MIKRTCSLPDCNKAHRARGLCATHYNQQHMPDRHPKKLVPCTYCGIEVLKGTGGGRVHGSVCSDQCRTWLTTPYSSLPKDHWARWYGKTCAWKPPAFVPEQRDCSWCGDAYTATREPMLYCTKRCSRAQGKVRRRGREASAPGNYTWAQVIGLHLLSDKCCSYCDQPVAQPEPDHVIPISRGGRNGTENILSCCPPCNADKGDMTPTEWARDRARRGKPSVRTSFDTTDPRFVHLMLGVASGESQRLLQRAHLDRP